jgi:DNA-binding XRE family transcriptional regulator
MRFVAKGFKSLRQRLGFSAAQIGKLLGVSEQSIYNWESK